MEIGEFWGFIFILKYWLDYLNYADNIKLKSVKYMYNKKSGGNMFLKENYIAN